MEQILRLKPLYQERVWGGRTLESFYGRQLPTAGTPYGESWEVVDREEAQSVVDGGEFDGKTLHELWQNHRPEIFGANAPDGERFPILVKILDARDRLSVQVHPPASIAGELGGEPKTEMWYIAQADPDAELYVGLDEGVTKDTFETALRDGTVESAVHRIPVSAGESIFIPSGRLHAIGAGLVIFEIQQNSDTTYRVFDWNRMGLDGQPRQLHVEESLRCIDFDDTAPGMDAPDGDTLAACEYFRVSQRDFAAGEPLIEGGVFAIVAVVDGEISTGGHTFRPGDFFIVPAGASAEARTTNTSGTVLVTTFDL